MGIKFLSIEVIYWFSAKSSVVITFSNSVNFDLLITYHPNKLCDFRWWFIVLSQLWQISHPWAAAADWLSAPWRSQSLGRSIGSMPWCHARPKRPGCAGTLPAFRRDPGPCKARHAWPTATTPEHVIDTALPDRSILFPASTLIISKDCIK